MICCRVRLSGAIYERSQLSEGASLVIEFFRLLYNLRLLKPFVANGHQKLVILLDEFDVAAIQASQIHGNNSYDGEKISGHYQLFNLKEVRINSEI